MSKRQEKREKPAREPLTSLQPPEDTAAILSVLSTGDIEVKGRLRWSSNATFLVAVRPLPGNRAGMPTLPAGSPTELTARGGDGGPAAGRSLGSPGGARDRARGGDGGPASGRSPGSSPGGRQGLGILGPQAGKVTENGGTRRPMLAIYKPTKGERPLWDFPRGLWKREVAAYELATALGWDIVPPTTARLDAPLGPGSLQYFVDALVEEHYFSLLQEPGHHEALRRIAVFDLIVNNADRKSGHCLLDRRGHIWAIDNGLCFHTEPKLRTVIWDFAGDEIGPELLAGLERLSRAEVPEVVTSLLDEEEIDSLSGRARTVFAGGKFPEPSGDFPYPWPLV